MNFLSLLLLAAFALAIGATAPETQSTTAPETQSTTTTEAPKNEPAGNQMQAEPQEEAGTKVAKRSHHPWSPWSYLDYSYGWPWYGYGYGLYSGWYPSWPSYYGHGYDGYVGYRSLLGHGGWYKGW